MRANIDDVYAAGDVCQAYDLTLGKPEINALWPNAVEQGSYAGANISGNTSDNLKYKGGLGINSVEFFGLLVISMGIFNPAEGDETLSYINQEKSLYKKLVLRDNHIIGALLLGDISNSGLYLNMIKQKSGVSKIKDDLLDENLSYAGISDLIKSKEEIYIK